MQNVVDVFNNLLDESNREGWSVLQGVSYITYFNHYDVLLEE